MADGFGLECGRNFHRGEREELRDVILNHVAQRARAFVIPSAMFYAEAFRDGDLNAGDAIAIPERLEERVREAKDQNVLHRLFAQIMIDAVNLLFLKVFVNAFVQRLGRFQIVAEWLSR